jgi:hypothetical protein
MAVDWYPRAHQAGLRRHAVIFAENYFGHRATELALAQVADCQLVGFASEADARRMLLAP